MLIALAVPALLFLIGLGIMMRNEDKCMKRLGSDGRREPGRGSRV